MSSKIAQEGQLLAKRARHVRNGIVHRTLPSPEAVEAVMDVFRFWVFRALWCAMEAATNGCPMRGPLDENGASGTCLARSAFGAAYDDWAPRLRSWLAQEANSLGIT